MTNCFVCQTRITGSKYYCCTSTELTCFRCSGHICKKCQKMRITIQSFSNCDHCFSKMDEPVKLPDGRVVERRCLFETFISYEEGRETPFYKNIEKFYPKCISCSLCVDGLYRLVGSQFEGNIICEVCLAQTQVEEKQLKNKQQRLQAIQQNQKFELKEAEKIISKQGEKNHVKRVIEQKQVMVCSECKQALKDEAEFEIKLKGKVYRRYCSDCLQRNPHIIKSLQPFSPVKLRNVFSIPQKPKQEDQSSIIFSNSLIRNPNKLVTQLIQKEGSDKKQQKQDGIQHIQSQTYPPSMIFPKMQAPADPPKEEQPKDISILPENIKLNQKRGSIAQRDEPLASHSSKKILMKAEFEVKRDNHDEFNVRQSSPQFQLIESVELVKQLLIINVKKEEYICCLDCNFRLLEDDAIFAQMKSNQKEYKVISLDEIHSKPTLKEQCIAFCRPCYYKQFYFSVPKRYSRYGGIKQRYPSGSIVKKPKQNAIQDMRVMGVSSSKRKNQSLRKPLRNCLTCKKELSQIQTNNCLACQSEKIMREKEGAKLKQCARCSEKVTSPTNIICQMCQIKEKHEARPLIERACNICKQRLYLFEGKTCHKCMAKRPNIAAKEPQRITNATSRYCASCKRLCQIVSRQSGTFCAVCCNRSIF